MTSLNSDDPIEQQIKKAQEEGAFDHLPGKGKPLSHLDSDPLHGVLQAQGFKLPWVERDREIQQKASQAEGDIQRAHRWAIEALGEGQADRAFIRNEWRKAQRVFRERIEEINRLIKIYNLEVPPVVGQKFLLKEEEEIEALGLTDLPGL